MNTKELRNKTTVDYNVWKQFTREERIEWHNKVADWEEEWEQWLFKEYEVEENPKKEKCFALSWEEGHASGYEEVENYFSKFVDLII